MKRFQARKVAVLGAGVMGAQIAAHLANVRVPVVLFDLPAKDGPKNGVVTRAIEGMKKLKPSPIGVVDDLALIQPANYDEHLSWLAGCDLVIEAIAERLDWKRDLYAKIEPHVASHAILASNTSGLSISALAEVLPAELRPRFCGIHFFNPPRYMHLVELIPTAGTEALVLDQLETFCTTVLGKGVVRAKDTPNFVANRLGVAGLLSTFVEAERFGLSYDVVDDLTGKKLGRASSGTFRTADVVGLDTMGHVVKTMQDGLKGDPFIASFATPKVLAILVEAGALGQKSGAGFYKKAGKDVLRFDPAKGEYVPAIAKADPVVAGILRKPAAERLKLLRESSHPQAQFLWAIIRNSLHYAAVHLADIADSAREVDLALRWGFGHQQGPFELWQEAGWQQVAKWIVDDIAAGKALCSAPLPAWVTDGRTGVHHATAGSWNAAQGQYAPRSSLSAYRRQHYPELLLGEEGKSPLDSGVEEFRNSEVRVWSYDGQVLVASITSKMHLLGPGLPEGLIKAVEIAEQDYKGLVIWSPDEMFSAGANLEALMPVFRAHGAKGVEAEVKKLQDTMLRIRYANVPVVAALRGIALGGGCELAVHCAKRVAGLETYMGLVEVGVGLIPAGGGLTYIARRAAENAQTAPGLDLLAFLREGFGAAATAKVGGSAHESRKLGYLIDGDVVVPNKDELLFVAINEAKAMAESGYRPPPKRAFPVAGRSALATFKAQLVGMRDGSFISPHDFHLASLIAEVVCGGEVEAGSMVTEEYLMSLELKHFCALLDHPKTQERISGMLQTGKPVRN